MTCQSLCLSVCLSNCSSVCLSVCPSVCLYVSYAFVFAIVSKVSATCPTCVHYISSYLIIAFDVSSSCILLFLNISRFEDLPTSRLRWTTTEATYKLSQLHRQIAIRTILLVRAIIVCKYSSDSVFEYCNISLRILYHIND